MKIIKNRLHISITLQTLYRDKPQGAHVHTKPRDVIMNRMFSDSIHYVSGIFNKLSTLVIVPWLKHPDDDDHNNY